METESGGISSRDKAGAVKEAEALFSGQQRYSVALRSPIFDVVSSVLNSAGSEANVTSADGVVKDLVSRFTTAQEQLEGYNSVSVDQNLKVDLNQRELDRILTLLRDKSIRDRAGAPVQVVAEVSRAFSKAKKKASPGIFRRIIDKIKPNGGSPDDEDKTYVPVFFGNNLRPGQAKPGRDS